MTVCIHPYTVAISVPTYYFPKYFFALIGITGFPGITIIMQGK